MYRKNLEFGPKLEALMDERDRLLGAFSLERDASQPDAGKLEDMLRRVMQLENQIKQNWGDGPERTTN